MKQKNSFGIMLKYLQPTRQVVKLASYEPAVVASLFKLFLRELPQPLLPSCLHAELRSAAMGHGAAGADIVTSMTTVLAKVECPTHVVYLQATATGITTSD